VPTWDARPGSARPAPRWPAPALLPALAIDGKAVRGAIGDDGQIPYLLGAATHTDSTVIAERLIGAKTNEVPEFELLLRGLPLGGWVLTMDAAHTVGSHARFITEQLLAHYVMIVKQNQKGLFGHMTPNPIRTRSVTAAAALSATVLSRNGAPVLRWSPDHTASSPTSSACLATPGRSGSVGPKRARNMGPPLVDTPVPPVPTSATRLTA